MKNIIYNIAVYIKKAFIVIIALLFLLLAVLQIPALQNYVAQSLLQRFNRDLQLPVSIGKFQWSFLNTVKLRRIFVWDTSKDTVFYADKLKISVSLTELLQQKLNVKAFSLRDSKFYLKKNQDSILNINTIIEQISKSNSPDKDTSASTFRLYLNSLNLADIHFSYIDSTTHNNIRIDVGKLNLKSHTLDLQNKKIAVESIQLEDVNYDMLVSDITSSDESEEPFEFDITLDESLTAQNVGFRLRDTVRNQDIVVEHADVKIKPKKIDIQRRNIEVAELQVKNTNVEISQYYLSPGDSAFIARYNSTQADTGSPWNIRSEKIILKDNRFVYDEETKQTGSQSLSQNRTVIDSISSEFFQAAKLENEYKVTIKFLKGTFNEDYRIKHIQGEAKVKHDSAIFRNIVVESGESSVNLNMLATYNSIGHLQEHPEKAWITINLNSNITSRDLNQLLPFYSGIKRYPATDLTAILEGSPKNLRIKTLSVNAGKAMKLDIEGHVKNIHTPESVSGEINIRKLFVDKNNLVVFISDTLFPENVNLPDEMTITGTVAGGKPSFQSDLRVLTPLGHVGSTLQVYPDSIGGKEQFTASLWVDSLDLGTILKKKDTLGLVSFTGQFKGTTSDFRHPDVGFDIKLQQANILDYNYRDIAVKGTYQNNTIQSEISSEDKNLKFMIDGKASLSDSLPGFKGDVNVSVANLHRLNLSEEKMKVSGRVRADISGKNRKNPDGHLYAENLAYQTGEQKYELDSLQLNFIQKKEQADFSINIKSLSADDSVIVHNANISAIFVEKEAETDYQIFFTDTVNEPEPYWIEGKGEVSLPFDSLEFNSQLKMTHYAYDRPLEFKISLKQTQIEEDQTSYKLNFQGEKSSMSATTGLISTAQGTAIDGQLDVDSFLLKLIAPLTRGEIKKLDGMVAANLKVQGSTNNPEFSGDVSILNLVVNPRILNTEFRVKKEQVKLKNNTISFTDFELTDDKKNLAVVNGTIDPGIIAESDINMSVKADKFRLLNKKASSGSLFYGHVIADLNADISGSLSAPVITLNSAFPYESDFSYVVLSNRSQAEGQKGIVTFEKPLEKKGSKNIDSLKLQKQIQPGTENVEIVTNLELTDQMTIHIIIDPVANESLKVSGNGNLSFSMDRGGDMDLAGMYEIISGKYRLKLYDVINREFEIEKGSYLQWQGEVLEPVTDIKAKYVVKTTLNELVRTRMPVSNEQNMAIYNQSVPVEVIMNMSGELLAPEIDFDIAIDEKYQETELQGVITNLNKNESEVNKQVFSLLVFNSFLIEGSTQRAPLSYELNNTARQTLGNLLSKQLNRFSSQYITSADVRFNIETYEEATGTRPSLVTDVGVDVSRSLFNERLSIQIGGNLIVDENEMGAARDYSNFLAGDFLVEYKLDEQGAYLLQGFNRMGRDDILVDDITKTGISFIFNKDFYTFHELFRTRTKKEKNKREK